MGQICTAARHTRRRAEACRTAGRVDLPARVDSLAVQYPLGRPHASASTDATQVRVHTGLNHTSVERQGRAKCLRPRGELSSRNSSPNPNNCRQQLDSFRKSRPFLSCVRKLIPSHGIIRPQPQQAPAFTKRMFVHARLAVFALPKRASLTESPLSFPT